jgi:phosphocarrier protein HPr
MLEAKVIIINSLGLHARAAARLVRVSTKFKSQIKLERTDNYFEADAKSILSILTLAAAQNTELIVRIEGEDEVFALKSVTEAFTTGFGED